MESILFLLNDKLKDKYWGIDHYSSIHNTLIATVSEPTDISYEYRIIGSISFVNPVFMRIALFSQRHWQFNIQNINWENQSMISVDIICKNERYSVICSSIELSNSLQVAL